MNTTGDVSIVPFADNGRFTGTVDFFHRMGFNRVGSAWVVQPFASFAIGRDLGSTAMANVVRVRNEVHSNGAIQVFADGIEKYAHMRVYDSGARLLLKSSARVWVNTNADFTTNLGDVTLWSNSDNATTGDNPGNIYLNNDLDFNTFNGVAATTTPNYASPWGSLTATTGGDITLGGGLASNGDANKPGGYAYSGNSNDHAIRLGTSVSTFIMNSSGGDISIRGQYHHATTGTIAVVTYGSNVLNSGAGKILIEGISTGAKGRGIEILHAANGNGFFYSTGGTSKSDPAITVKGSTMDTGDTGILGAFWSDGPNNFLVQALGTGGILFEGSAPANSSRGGIEMNGAALLAPTGDITVDGGAAGVRIGNYFSAYGERTSVFGFCNPVLNSVPRCANSLVPTASSSDVKIIGDKISTPSSGANMVVATTGGVVVEPKGDTFAAATTWSSNSNGIASLRVGKDNGLSTSSVTVAGTHSVVGDVEIYGRDVYPSASFTQTGAGTNASKGLLFKAQRSVINMAAGNFRTNGSPITFWADQDMDGAGAVAVANGSTMCTKWTGSACATTGGADITLAGAEADANFPFRPAGWASGSGTVNMNAHLGATTSGEFPLSGVSIGFTASSSAVQKIVTAGGNLLVRGQTTNGAVASSQAAIGVIGTGASSITEFNVGAGKIRIDSNARCASVGSGSQCAALELNAWGSSTPANTRLISTNTADDSISITATSSLAAHKGTSNIHGSTFTTAGGLKLLTSKITDDSKFAFNVTGDIAITSPNQSFDAVTNIDSDWSFTIAPASFLFGNAASSGSTQNAADINSSIAISARDSLRMYGGNIALKRCGKHDHHR
jgi:hypothetical protein